MTQSGHRILVVAHSARLAGVLLSWLGESPNEVVLTNSYASAKRQLTRVPDVLITEVKLGEYNGLQLALRGQIAGIPTIVVGPADGGFDREAERFGATYLTAEDLESASLSSALRLALDKTDRHDSPMPPLVTPVSAGPVVH